MGPLASTIYIKVRLKADSKIYMKMKSPRTVTLTLTKNKVRGPILPLIRDYEATVSKIEWYQFKNRQMD